MAIGPPSSAVFLQPPSTATSQGRPLTVTLHPAALFSILDHYLRRTTPTSQQRVIGTLLGTRNESNEIEIKNSFAVLHSETDEQVAVDMDYHRGVYELFQKVNSKEVIVGWYSTGGSLDTYSALIQNFYSQETAPHPSIHIVVNTGTQEPGELGVKAYVSSPVGVHPKPENCTFIPVPVELRFHDAERSGVNLLASASSPVSTSKNELDLLEKSIRDVIEMIDRVLSYVQSVTSGQTKGDERVGRYLLDTLSENVHGLEKGRLETLFNSHLQDTLMVSYLSNLVRSQVEISSRLALLP
ncbi:hypothetical protein FRC03_007673 [Tulasnella sp. 419]|nr:hypothetical protein FRC02_008756 [Tulasnella sp. 418]KAG8959643.1 hypothetical protein FRC03_007673 [Tulasnella sp. 419]